MNKDDIQLSAVLVAGACRGRGERVLEALGRQTISGYVEAVVVDLGPARSPPLKAPPSLNMVYLRKPPSTSWGEARAQGAEHSSGTIVAFLEDHCYPAPGWAEVLVERHRGPWAAVGYGFTNANPRTRVSRAGLLADYGPWTHPALSGEERLLPGNNISYKRTVLMESRKELPSLLAADLIIQESFRERGKAMFVEGRALVAHENYDRLTGILLVNHHYCRLLASNRAHAQSWSRTRRMVYGLGAPLGVPAIRLVQLVGSLKGRRPLWKTVIPATPLILLIYLAAGVGEALGYLFGEGISREGFRRWELGTVRTS
jgi:hypothetical protein